jgi:hypothetical protein
VPALTFYFTLYFFGSTLIMITATLQWVYRLGFILTLASANVVSTHGEHQQVEVTSTGEVVRTNANPEASKPFKKLADGIAKAMVGGFDTEKTHVEADSYMLGEAKAATSTQASAAAVYPPVPHKTVLLNVANGSFYTINLCFGNPAPGAQEMCLPGIPDTGSFELVVRSTRCAKCSEPMYNDSMSTTFIEPIHKRNYTELMYGSGPVKCVWVKDDVKIKGSVTPNLISTVTGASTGVIVKQQRLLEATGSPISDFARSSTMCGIYGIGRGLVEGREERFIKRAGIQRYSICLPREQNADGEMWWQTADPKSKSLSAWIKDEKGKPQANPEYPNAEKPYKPINVIGHFHWAVQMEKMKLHYQKKPKVSLVHTIQPTPACAILDSGTTLIAPTTTMATNLMAAITELNAQGLDCKDENIAKLPTLEFTLDGQPHRLPPEAYVAKFDVMDENTTKLSSRLLHFKPQSGCMLLLTKPMDTEQKPGECPMMILGMPFFRFYKTVFDWDAKSVANTTDTGMVYTVEHSGCTKEGVNSWDTTASNYVGKSTATGSVQTPSAGMKNVQRSLMKVNPWKLKFPKAHAHYFQHGKL